MLEQVRPVVEHHKISPERNPDVLSLPRGHLLKRGDKIIPRNDSGIFLDVGLQILDVTALLKLPDPRRVQHHDIIGITFVVAHQHLFLMDVIVTERINDDRGPREFLELFVNRVESFNPRILDHDDP